MQSDVVLIYIDSISVHNLNSSCIHQFVCKPHPFSNKSFLLLPGADLARDETGPIGACCPVLSCGSRSRKSSVLVPDGGRPKAGRGARAPVSSGKKSLKSEAH